MTCPCCGYQADKQRSAIASARGALTVFEEKIYDVLARSPGLWVDGEALIDRVYRDDETGGPDGANLVINTLACRMSKKIRPFGLALESRKGRGNTGRRLVWQG